jgi:hypothetical protein
MNNIQNVDILPETFKSIQDDIYPLLMAVSPQKHAITASKVDLALDPSPTSAALFLDDIPLICKGELCTIVALPGTGKTNVCEGIVASYVHAKGFDPLDALNFTCPPDSVTASRVLWVDTERTPNDLLKSVKRLKNRCNVNSSDLDGVLDFFSFAELSAEQSINELSFLTDLVGYDIVLIDGILDFCPDINNIEKATTLVKQLRAIAVKHNIAVVTTIHPNKGTDVIAGHLGAMLYRFSRAVVYIEKQVGEIRRLTSEIGQGKLSYSSTPVNVFIKWCNDRQMLVSCNITDTVPTSYKYETVIEIFDGGGVMASKDFKSKYAQKTKLGTTAVNSHCAAMAKDGVISRTGNGSNTIYRLESEEVLF